MITRQVIDGPRTDVADTTTYVWDNAGNLSSVTNGLGHITALSNYDAHGRPQQITDPRGHLTTNVYDALSRLVKVIDPAAAGSGAGGTTHYAYDGADQLTQVTDPRNLATRYTLDGLGNLTQQVSPKTGTTANRVQERGQCKKRGHSARKCKKGVRPTDLPRCS